jgi:hypothetical protein
MAISCSSGDDLQVFGMSENSPAFKPSGAGFDLRTSKVDNYLTWYETVLNIADRNRDLMTEQTALFQFCFR